MCAHILLVLMSAVNQPHVSPARSQKEPRGTKPIVSQEIFDLHSRERRMLLSWGFGIADTGRDQIFGLLGVSGPAAVILAQQAIT